MNSPPEIAKLCLQYGINKIEKPKIKIFVLSIIGGIFVGASSLLSNICSYGFYGGRAQFYAGLVFPIGIMAVYCAGGELFTGNCLLTIPFFNGNITWKDLLLNWLITLIGNFIGANLISLLIVYGHITNMFNIMLTEVVINTGIEKCSLNFGDALIKGLLCNFYNCLGIWVSLGGRDMRSVILGMWTPTFLFAACGMEHCVANMYYITAGIFASYEYDLDMMSISWGRLFYKNLIPVIIGNILGGGALVGVFYWYVYLTLDENEIHPNISKNLETLNGNANIINPKDINTNNESNIELHADMDTINVMNNK